MAFAHVIGAVFALTFGFAELDRLVLVTALRSFLPFAAFAACAAIETPGLLSTARFEAEA
jgi:hypothetical protein